MNSAEISGVEHWGCAARELIMISLNTVKSTFTKKKYCSFHCSYEFITTVDVSTIVLCEWILSLKVRPNLRLG
jgi:hypothetical protein